jgi:glycine/D-amino acid oxidase-like deaminating enzyme
VARVGDDERMVELKRRVASGKAFGNRVEMITPAEAKAKFPLLEEDMIQGALWDPDAGLVKPRSQMVAGELVDAAVATGKLLSFANTACTGLRIENGRIQGVETTKGYIAADYVVVCAGLWCRWTTRSRFSNPTSNLRARAKTLATRCCVTKATRRICAILGTPKRLKAARLNGVITKKKIRACATRVICWRKSKRVCRLRSAT